MTFTEKVQQLKNQYEDENKWFIGPMTYQEWLEDLVLTMRREKEEASE